ncbi:hypothetical protein Poli38472_013334 [Pythium oligandrum]|uniref:Uncharacterized protein n=1 Tax=Pythium oligandrum TaxID=41045 RepID=A0A8K1C7S3_PYTOL|nr:hypothetical protein Poli38472_013334 [Pythium oligandrum]|eukprot:TMW57860.1 hypothetical protein Poli38472_013334 [Pythium oligandrum]
MLARFVYAATLVCSTLLVGLTMAPSTTVNALTRDEVRLAMQVYNNHFYNDYGAYGNSRKAMYYGTTERKGRDGFWTTLEEIEVLIDAYGVTRDTQFKDRIRHLYNGFRDAHGLTWANNEFNDDIIWGVIMAIRAFQVFNDGAMKQMAIDNFNIVWKRGWDDKVGGGIWWKTDKKSKNVCVNAPAAIAAMLLYKNTGDAVYKDRARKIMQWIKSKLFDAKSGEVKGAMNAAGKITEGWRTYTQGTFIGAAGKLHKEYPSEGWLDVAIKATDFSKSTITGKNGLLPDEYCDGQSGGDCSGFKGIFARWVGFFVRDHKLQDRYAEWLEKNAKAAWAVRNGNGLMWAKWGQRTPDKRVFSSWEASSGVAMMSAVFAYNNDQKVLRQLRSEE